VARRLLILLGIGVLCSGPQFALASDYEKMLALEGSGFPFGAANRIALVERADGDLAVVMRGSTVAARRDPQLLGAAVQIATSRTAELGGARAQPRAQLLCSRGSRSGTELAAQAWTAAGVRTRQPTMEEPARGRCLCRRCAGESWSQLGVRG
jgi:hypothetical protein